MPLETSTQWMMVATAAMAAFTFLAVFAALFGEAIRALMFKPKLSIELRSKYGDLTEANLLSPAHPDGRRVPARYYHLLISNRSSVTKATQAQVYLTRVETPGPDGKLQVRWDSEVPLRWAYQEINPLVRTIGPTAWCDLFNIVKDKWLELDTVIVPYSLMPLWRHLPEPCHIVLTVQARSAEGVSPMTRFEVIWNGQWHDGKEEMVNNVIIRCLPDQEIPGFGGPVPSY